MLGHKLLQVLGSRHEVWCTVRSEDSARLVREAVSLPPERIRVAPDLAAQAAGVAADVRPDVIVNCVGVVKQRPSSQDAVETIAVNALLPHQLAEAAAEAGSRLVHISTDCVFSGEKGGYNEADRPDAPDLYGRSKALGEPGGGHVLVLRTSIIGRELSGRRSLLEWLISNAGSGVPGYTRVRWNGLTTFSFSQLIATLIDEHPRLAGLYHVGSEPLSKYDLLMRLNAALDLGVAIEPDATLVQDRTLDYTALGGATGYVAPAWDEMISELALDCRNYT
jgi:dTDP-4-dehydrorhamnose reductase